jgi:hypothetical protein
LAGVEDDEAETLAPAPLVEVPDGDPVHPPTASSKLAAATVAASRCLVFFN